MEYGRAKRTDCDIFNKIRVPSFMGRKEIVLKERPRLDTVRRALEDSWRTKYSTSDPVYNHCLAVFIENLPDMQPRQESISEMVIISFGILFMGWCSKKKTLEV